MSHPVPPDAGARPEGALMASIVDETGEPVAVEGPRETGGGD
jgi:hypothetical protein